MKKITIIMLSAFFIFGCATAPDRTDHQRKSYAVEKRSGCCSWHDGVCGCRNGHAVCCDGTVSPSCGCD